MQLQAAGYTTGFVGKYLNSTPARSATGLVVVAGAHRGCLRRLGLLEHGHP